jgi:ribonuclease HI
VGRTVKRHATWAACERRVKGVSGARFKKTRSAEDEAKVLEEWGVKAHTRLKCALARTPRVES